MARYMADEKESTFFVDVLKIALGVFIGGLLAALAYTKYMAWEVEYSLRQATAEMQKQAKQQADRSRKQAEDDRQRREAAARESR
jgi:Na+/H+ antiporter NhaB